jgi:predicted XRE-type DNA-binding protein
MSRLSVYFHLFYSITPNARFPDSAAHLTRQRLIIATSPDGIKDGDAADVRCFLRDSTSLAEKRVTLRKRFVSLPDWADRLFLPYIRHVTKPGANLFAELGFAPEEARQYQAESQALINQTATLKEQLMGELASWIEVHHLKQAEAAEILHVTRPRVSDVVNKKTSKFTIDSLVDMLARIGTPVKVVVG